MSRITPSPRNTTEMSSVEPQYMPMKEKVFTALEKSQSVNATKILHAMSENMSDCLLSGASTPPNDTLNPESGTDGDVVKFKQTLLRELLHYFKNKRESFKKKRKRRSSDPDAALYKNLKPEAQKKGDTCTVPVFRPTTAQFKSFRRLMQAIEPYGRESGLVKVIPPDEWLEAQPTYMLDRLKATRIKKPITQMFTGHQGVFQQFNVESSKVYTVPMWQQLCESFEEAALRASHRHSFSHLDFTYEPSAVYKASQRCDTEGNASQQDSAVKSETSRASTVTPADSEMNLESPINGAAASAPGACVKSEYQRRKEQFEEKAAKEIRAVDWEKITGNRTCFSAEFCQELERFYWRNISFYKPTYGADLKGTLFGLDWDDAWNITKLDNLLRDVLHKSIPGVNSPYLYFGMFLATFAWHLEDMDLFSINYLHFGSPKQWYVIPQAHRLRFENLCRRLYGPEAMKCPQFLRHKSCLLSPKVLASHSIPVLKTVHYPGEIMITFPYGYHSGYNLGFNCAESLNFALDSWLKIASQAGHCHCVNHSVQIDVDRILQTAKPGKVSKQAKPSPIPKAKEIAPPRCQLCAEVALQSGEPLVEFESDVKASVVRYAHRLCVEAIPETAMSDSGGRAVGLDLVPNARRKLKCFICKNIPVSRLPSPYNKWTACIQCCKGKCARSFHPLCAQRSGLKLELSPGGKPEFVCPKCDPDVVKAIQSEKGEKHLASLKAAAASGVPVDVSVRWRAGNCYVGKLVSVDMESQTCEVTFDDDDDVYSVPCRDVSLN